MSKYADDRQIKTALEKLLPPVVTWMLRKLVLGAIRANLAALRIASKPFSFHYSAEVSDRDPWVWNIRERIPLYRARVEKVE